MLETLLGSKNAERVLMFVAVREEGYARDIARYFVTDLYAIQKQLDKFETSGILASRLVGRTRIYVFNPRYPFINELKNLLSKAFTFYRQEEQDNLTMIRRRPRRRGKPL